MADLSSAIIALVVLFVTAAVGFLVTRLGWFDKHIYTGTCEILINVAFPCMIVSSVAELDRDSGGGLVLASFGYGFALYFGLFLLCLLCNVLLRVPKGRRGCYVFMGTLTNLAFIGIPVTVSLFGPMATFVVALFILSTNLVIYTFGVIVCSRLDGVVSKIDLRMLVSGPLIGVSLAVLIFLTGIELPPIVAEPIEFIGGITAPLAMIMVGYIVAASDARKLVGEWRIYVVSLIRQLVVPAAMWLLLRGIAPEPMVFGVFVVAFAMPVGTIVPAIAANYGLDDELSAKGTVISTTMSFATIPALVAIMSL